MVDTKDTPSLEDLRGRNEAELRSLIATKSEALRAARFKHALGQLRETHTLRATRQDIARLKTLIGQRGAAGEETT